MKRFLLTLLIGFLATSAFAQSGSDSVAYQIQRKKINDMLDQRRLKFGQYDQSLSKHTGIFGLQTKKDIRRSNDILMDIVKTDNEIFDQLKVLLDYRLSQQKEVQSHSVETESNSLGYMSTINRLQAENAKLRDKIDKNEQSHLRYNQFAVAIGLILIIIIVLLARAMSKRK